jgi:hypothetical protein
MKKHLATLMGALALFAATPALCDQLLTQCVKHDCARMRCDDWGENCSRVGSLESTHGNLAAPVAHQTCDEFGDCHFALPSFPPVPKQKPAAKPTAAVAPATPAVTVVPAAPAAATPPATPPVKTSL